MQPAIDIITDFKPGQILYIEHHTEHHIQHCRIRLYAEVIQAVSDRQLCWVRPLALISLATDSPLQHHPTQWSSSGTELESVDLYDLRQGADLVCPQSLFQVALDTEVMPILVELHRLKPRLDVSALGENDGARERLREFVRLVWQSNPKLFSSKPFN